MSASAPLDSLGRRRSPAAVSGSPHQLRHTHALELLRQGVPLNVIQRQLEHRNPGVTSIHLQDIDPQ